jgi:hypothetical protein
MTCPAFRDITTGIFQMQRIVCAGKHKEGKPHKSDWITDSKINELTQTKKVRVEWLDA